MADDVQNTMKPIAPNDQDKFNQQIIQFRVDPDTGFYTLSCSTDNGLHYQVILTADGRKFSDKDAASFWPFLKKYVSSLIDGVTIEWAEVKGKPEVITKDQLEERLAKLAIPTSFSWSDITDKPSDLVHEQALQDVKSTASSAKELAEKNASLLDNKADVGQIPKTMSWGNITEKPRLALESDIPSLDGYAKLSQIPRIDGLVREAELTAYAKHNELPVIPTDLVHSAELDKAKADIVQAKQMATDAEALANNAVKETELVNYAKKSDLPDVSELAKTDAVEAAKATAESAVSKAEKAQSTAEANSKALADKANKSEIPNLSGYALKSELPSLDGYAKLTDIPSVAGLVKEAELADYAKKSDLPNLSGYVKVSDLPSVTGLVKQTDLVGYAKLSDIPKPPDLTSYAKTSEVDEVKATADSALSNAEKAQSTADANTKALANKANKSEIPVVPTDLVHTAEMEQVKETANQSAQTASQAMSAAKSAKPAIDTSDEFTVKKPSEYPEGFSYELKEVFELIPDRSNLDVTAQEGYQAIVTTEVCKGYARQTVKVIDSERPLTFIRNGIGSTWYPFEQINTWSV